MNMAKRSASDADESAAESILTFHAGPQSEGLSVYRSLRESKSREESGESLQSEELTNAIEECLARFGRDSRRTVRRAVTIELFAAHGSDTCHLFEY